jgi:hypothetical protein
MALDLFKNFAKVQVSTGYDDTATSIALTAGHGTKLPAPPFNATWWNDTDYPDPSDDPNVEIVRVTAVASDTVTVTRAQESTTASTKNTASKTYRMIAGLTAKTFNTDIGSAVAQISNGRLTLASGDPGFDALDVTAATTIYFTPFKGNIISLHTGSSWVSHSFSELSLALGTLTSDKNYDVFLYNNAGTLTLELSAAWATNSTRTDAVILQDGIYVKSGATTRRYLGSFRTTSTTTTEDSELKRFLWNVDNQIIRRAFKDMTGSHTYSVTAWRMYNGDATNKIEVLVGKPATASVGFSAGISGTANLASYVGVGINTTAGPTGSFAFANANIALVQGVLGQPTNLTMGYSELNLIQYTSNSAIYQGASISATLFT